MKKIANMVLAGLIITLSAFTFQQTTNWGIAEGYAVKFAGTEAEGIFKTVTGNIQFDAQDLASSNFHFLIDVNSINTGNGMKNKHAKSDKWFDAEQFPNIEFQSSGFSKTAAGYTVTGKLTIHGIAKEVTLPFTFANNTFVSNFSVNRLDYNVGTMKGMMKKVSNEIKLDVSIPVAKK